MPRTPLLAAMPGRGEVTHTGDVLSSALSSFRCCVVADVFARRQALKIVDIVVGRVAVDVVNVVPWWDDSVMVLPLDAVQKATGLRTVVVAGVGGGRFWVPAKGFAVEADPVTLAVLVGHVSIISAYRKASSRVQPCPCTQTG